MRAQVGQYKFGRHINGRGISRECYATTVIFYCELGECCSFRWESIVKVY